MQSFDIALVDLAWAVAALAFVVYPLKKIRNSDGGGGPFSALLLIIALYPTALACFHLTPFDIGLVYALTAFAAPLYFITMSRYLGLNYGRSAGFRRLLLGIAAVISLTALTNPWYGLFGVTHAHVVGQPNHLLDIHRAGIGMQMMYGYTLLLVAVTICLALFHLLRSRFNLPQLLVAVILPMAAGVSFASSQRLGLLEDLGISGLILVTTGLLFLLNLALISQRFLVVRPISRGNLMDLIPDAMAVVGPHGIVLDCNDTFARLWGVRAQDLVDESVPEELADYLTQGRGELMLGGGASCRYFDARTLAVGGGATRMVLLRDITDQTLASQRLARNRVQLRAANRELERLSTTDALTGLRNRRYFLDQLERELARVCRGGPTFGLLALDIDHFKRVNDEFGHAGGDRALIHVARVMEDQCRVTDTLARMGGEEFSLLAVATDADALLIAAERMRAAIANNPVQMGEGRELAVTASFGMAIATADADPMQLLQQADTALYEAKAAGRNRICLGPNQRGEPSSVESCASESPSLDSPSLKS